MSIVEFDRSPPWSLDASKTGESTKWPWVEAVEFSVARVQRQRWRPVEHLQNHEKIVDCEQSIHRLLFVQDTGHVTIEQRLIILLSLLHSSFFRRLSFIMLRHLCLIPTLSKGSFVSAKTLFRKLGVFLSISLKSR